MVLADFVLALGQRLEIADLALQENGVACVEIPKQFEVSVEQLGDSDECLIYAYIERVQEASQSAMYAWMLEANSFGLATNDAVLSIDKQTSRVVVHRKFSLRDLSTEQFIENWMGVVGVAAQWNERLTGFPEASQPGLSVNAEEPSAGQWLSV